MVVFCSDVGFCQDPAHSQRHDPHGQCPDPCAAQPCSMHFSCILVFRV